ncbi:UPF0669 protein C6orf120 homolog [Oppia nitens]|uniref:UPF0669 protein C6orf120 homolog n=1 Tax=Oppia nitens TaxID=1686743 RepID=UPI0023D9EA5C|nr:UPF0669 protein C6orf120 homolog [Oppia nitens]
MKCIFNDTMYVWIQSLFVIIITFWCLNVNTCLADSSVLFIESVDGSIESGNYSYYSYNGNNKLRLVLTTHSGDADLYVSEADANGRTLKPKYDFSEHDFQSVTCGKDVIHVDKHMRRPIGIGVYGHPSHETSLFTLDVIGVDYFDDNDRDQHNIYLTDDELDFYQEFFGEPFRGLDNKVSDNRHKSAFNADNKHKTDKHDDKHSETWDFFINLLANILHILLEVIV